MSDTTQFHCPNALKYSPVPATSIPLVGAPGTAKHHWQTYPPSRQNGSKKKKASINSKTEICFRGYAWSEALLLTVKRTKLCRAVGPSALQRAAEPARCCQQILVSWQLLMSVCSEYRFISSWTAVGAENSSQRHQLPASAVNPPRRLC